MEIVKYVKVKDMLRKVRNQTLGLKRLVRFQIGETLSGNLEKK